ncbi:MAG: DUF2889 domain-containing protein [Novosphingobium sp.]|nr:DUF2889 domain-containing protein [Novosphingobium sp.]
MLRPGRFHYRSGARRRWRQPRDLAVTQDQHAHEFDRPVKAGRLAGKRLAGLREEVLAVLPGTLGCTHPKDVLRAMADIPILAKTLV